MFLSCNNFIEIELIEEKEEKPQGAFVGVMAPANRPSLASYVVVRPTKEFENEDFFFNKDDCLVIPGNMIESCVFEGQTFHFCRISAIAGILYDENQCEEEKCESCDCSCGPFISI